MERVPERGWAATAGGEAPRPPLRRGEMTPLFDGQETFRRVLQEIEAARESLLVLQLYHKRDFVPDPEHPGRPTLNEALRDAAQRGVRVRILLNGNRLAPDDWQPTRRWFRQHAPGLPILVRKYPVAPGVAHAKVLLADGERAILIDPPFEPRWWDTRAHPLRSRRRGPGIPEHSVSCALAGEIVQPLLRFFVQLWDDRAEASEDGEARLALPAPPPGAAGASLLQPTLTSPAKILAPEGWRTVLESYRRALERAEGWVYIENQYFTSTTVRAAIAEALERNPALEVVLLLNEKPDTPTYARRQVSRLRELGWPREPRVRAFSLWSVGRLPEGDVGARPIYLHSKVAVVDDRWATLGSANLDGIALEGAREFGLRHARSIELNVALFDGVEGEPARGDIAAFRAKLWSEHLGRAPASLLPTRSDWPQTWSATAEGNLARLEAGEDAIQGHVLPFRAELPRGVRSLGWGAPAWWLSLMGSYGE